MFFQFSCGILGIKVTGSSLVRSYDPRMGVKQSKNLDLRQLFYCFKPSMKAFILVHINKKNLPMGGFLLCDPGGIQTHDLQNRNLTFYSAELRDQKLFYTLCLNNTHYDVLFSPGKSKISDFHNFPWILVLSGLNPTCRQAGTGPKLFYILFLNNTHY